MTDQLTSVDKRVRLPLGITLILGTAVAACARISSELPNTTGPVVDNSPRSADTNVAPIKPTMVDGSFDGADKIKNSCEQELKRKCEIFGILYTNEKGEAKISPFANDEKNNYFVWLGEDKFEPLTEKMDGDKVKWVNDTNDVYFVGVPREDSDTELKTLYYIDPNLKAWEISEPRAFHRAAIVKSTVTPTTAPTATNTPTETATQAPTATSTSRPTNTQAPTNRPPEVSATPKPTEGVPFSEGGINGLRSNVPLPGKEPRFPNRYAVTDCRKNPACDTVYDQKFNSLEAAQNYWLSKYPNAVLKYEYWLFADGGVSTVFVDLVSEGVKK